MDALPQTIPEVALDANGIAGGLQYAIRNRNLPLLIRCVDLHLEDNATC
ncbi:MAG: hypothetical protein LBI39_02130 [Puniceicoccales bacterium]|nr:hypothetical protein [Puniceicoccales bacterium]